MSLSWGQEWRGWRPRPVFRLRGFPPSSSKPTGKWAAVRGSTGMIIPALFLELTYHLKHHLDPQVPSHHLPELSRRLEPFFQEAGVEPRKVP